MDFRETEAMNEASVMEERATVDQEAETATAGAGGSKSIDARRFDVVTDPSRDALLTDFGKETLEDRYLLPNEGYQDLFARVASAYADDQEHAQRLYDAISKLWFMPATPVLSNGGTGRGLPISCYLNSVDDSLEGIVNTWNENVWLASRGGGIGTYWGNVRGIGEPVGLNGKTSGIIPFVRVMDSLTLAISQGAAQWPDGRDGEYLTVWRRQRDGSYLWQANIAQELDRPLEAPDFVSTEVANCAEPVPPDQRTVSSERPAIMGQSDDGSLQYAIHTIQGGSTVTLLLWDGEFEVTGPKVFKD